MASVPHKTLLAVCALMCIAVACGPSEDSNVAQMSQLQSLQENNFASDPSVLNDVSLTDKAGSSTTVTPSFLPKAGETARNLEVIFYPRLSVKNVKFIYDKSKWTVAIGNNVQFVTGADILEVKEDGNFSTGEIREGQIKLTIRLTAQGQWPEKVTNDAALTTIDGRKALKIQPYYSLDGAVAPGNSGTLQGLSAAYMKDDIGAIAASANLGSTAVSDGAFSVEFSAPDDTTAADTSTGSITSVGKSNVSGYVVVYWKDSECKAGGWSFYPNKVFDKTKAFSDLSCSYPGIESATSGTNSCNLACNTVETDDFFGKSANDIAIPPEFPSETGTENAIKRGCLNVVRVAADGRTSYAVNNAVNGETYGVMVYPLDSSSHIGMSRSKCAKVQPFNVEFPSARKSPGLGKSKSDCFVVTAAAGSTQSPAVHYWRVLRDSWLDKIGLSSFYYTHAPRWAAWLDAHPKLKPTLNSFFEWSGRSLVRVSQWMENLQSHLHSSLSRVTSLLRSAFISEANADDNVPSGEVVGLKYPFGSAATTLTIAGGQIRPSEDQDLYNLSYKDKKPAFLFISQTFRVVDLAGELGLGYELTGLTMKGSSPDSTHTEITLSGYGGGLVGEYRLRIGEHPWIAPRVAAVFGKIRMREEAAAVSSSSSSSSSGSASSGSDISPSGTTPVWQTYGAVRFYLDLPVSRLYGDDENLIRYGYEAEDMTLSLFAGMNSNNGQVISTSGLQLGGGITFFFR